MCLVCSAVSFYFKWFVLSYFASKKNTLIRVRSGIVPVKRCQDVQGDVPCL